MKRLGWFLVFLGSTFCALGQDGPILRYVMDDYPPKEIYETLPDGRVKYSGIDVDIVREFARRLDRELVILPCPFKRCLKMMETGDADMQSSLLKRPAREVFMHYLDIPYETSTPKVFYLRRNMIGQIKTYDDLYRLPNGVGHLLGAKYFERFDQDTALKKIAIKDIRHGFFLLSKGRLDATVNTELTGDYFVVTLGLADEIGKAPLRYEKATEAYFTVSKQSPLAKELPRVNRLMKEMVATGFVERVKATYRDRYGLK